MKLSRLISISFAVFCTACSQGSGDVVATDKPLGKIVEVSQKPNSVFVVKTSSGETVYPKSLASIKTGEEAVLVTRKYSSGMVLKDLCIKDDCVSLMTQRNQI